MDQSLTGRFIARKRKEKSGQSVPKCGHTPGKVAGQRATVKAEMNGFTPGLDYRPPPC